VALKLVGAAYLFYLGFNLLRTKHGNLALGSLSPRPLGKLFFDGAFSNISNPKVALFYFAFLPQFVSPTAQHPTITIFTLGITFALLTFLVKTPVGLFAGMLSGWLRSRPSVLKWVYRSSGAVMVGLGVKLAFERR
jgi:threonine/homoserine/homoserine lactone efflux protein